MRRPLRAQPRRQVWPPFTIAAIVGLTACNAALGSASVLRDWAVRVGTGPAARAKPHLRAAVSLGSEQSTALQRRPLDLPAAKQSFIQWWYAAHVGVVPMHGVGGLDGDLTMSRIQLPATRPQCPPWNKGRLIGQKRPLLPRQVWAIRARLELADNLRDLALFNLAIDSKLRGCDLVRLKVVDLGAGGSVRDRASVVQNKTGRPVQFEVSENAWRSVLAWITSRPMLGQIFLFPSKFHGSPHISTRQYARLVDDWVICNRTGSKRVWHAFPKADEGRVDLPEDRQSARGPAPARPHQGGQHGPVPWRRTRRRAEHRREDGHLRLWRTAAVVRHPRPVVTQCRPQLPFGAHT